MGKSPAKWIKTLLLEKKSSKSNLSKDATLDNKTSITANAPSNDIGDDSMVISSPMPPVTYASGEHTVEPFRSIMGLNTSNEDELIRLEQAATMAQAAFRGYLARRAFRALKGIIRLQALVRGHLVRRQAVTTLSCMRAIVEFQALIRGRKVRLSGNNINRQVLQKYTPGEPKAKKGADLLGTSLRSEKLSTNAFGTKLVASSHTTSPLSIQYDPVDPNSARNWLNRWSSSHFWDPLPRPKKMKLKTKTGRPKRSVRTVPPTNLYTNPFNSSENEKPKRPMRKISTHQTESAQEQSNNELEKVRHSLRKISVPTVAASEKSKLNDLNNEIKQQENDLNEAHDDPLNVELHDGNEYNSSKENKKTRRRKSFPAKQEMVESVSQSGPTLPSYMSATESAKAKLRAQAAAEDGGENGFVRRHSLLSSTVKLSLPSPQVPKPLQTNVKVWIKSNKSQISPRDDKKLKTGWKR